MNQKYNNFNWCSGCEKNVPKECIFCPDCNKRTRAKARGKVMIRIG